MKCRAVLFKQPSTVETSYLKQNLLLKIRSEDSAMDAKEEFLFLERVVNFATEKGIDLGRRRIYYRPKIYQIYALEMVTFPRTRKWFSVFMKENGLAYRFISMSGKHNIFSDFCGRRFGKYNLSKKFYQRKRGKTVCVVIHTEEEYQEIQRQKQALEEFRTLMIQYKDEESFEIYQEEYEDDNGEPTCRYMFNRIQIKEKDFTYDFMYQIIEDFERFRQFDNFEIVRVDHAYHPGPTWDIKLTPPAVYRGRTGKIEENEHYKELLEAFEAGLGDFTIINDSGARIGFNRTNLYIVSDYFKALFTTKVGDKKPNEIRLEYSSYVIKDFRFWLYNQAGWIKTVMNLEYLEEFFHFAQELGANNLYRDLVGLILRDRIDQIHEPEAFLRRIIQIGFSKSNKIEQKYIMDLLKSFEE